LAIRALADYPISDKPIDVKGSAVLDSALPIRFSISPASAPITTHDDSALFFRRGLKIFLNQWSLWNVSGQSATLQPSERRAAFWQKCI
jgi:hypothetical protein